MERTFGSESRPARRIKQLRVFERGVVVGSVLLLTISLLVSSLLGALPGQGGHISPKTYTSTVFGFSYTYPGQLIPNTLDFRRKLNPIQKGEAQEGVLFSAFETPSPGKVRAGVAITADNATVENANWDAKHCMQKVTIFLSSQGWSVLRQDRTAAFDGQNFLRTDYKRSSPVVFQSVACTIWEGSALEFIFSAGSEGDIDQLSRSLETIRFRDPTSKTVAH